MRARQRDRPEGGQGDEPPGIARPGPPAEGQRLQDQGDEEVEAHTVSGRPRGGSGGRPPRRWPPRRAPPVRRAGEPPPRGRSPCWPGRRAGGAAAASTPRNLAGPDDLRARPRGTGGDRPARNRAGGAAPRSRDAAGSPRRTPRPTRAGSRASRRTSGAPARGRRTPRSRRPTQEIESDRGLQRTLARLGIRPIKLGRLSIFHDAHPRAGPGAAYSPKRCGLWTSEPRIETTPAWARPPRGRWDSRVRSG